MLTIDTHCHVGLDWFEPVEVLLFQMERNQVDKAVLVQTWTFDNTYLVECLRRFPGRFAAVGHIDIRDPEAPSALERWARQGLQGLRLSLLHQAEAPVPVSVLQKAAELGMVVSCMGLPRHYVSAAFSDMVEAAPDVPFMIEHLGYVKHDDPFSHKAFDELLGLARYSNVFMKVPGLGELMPRPMPLTHPPFDLSKAPPFIDMAFDAFGANRLTIGTDSPPSSHREGYGNVVRYLREYVGNRSREEQEAVFGGTALSLFRFA